LQKNPLAFSISHGFVGQHEGFLVPADPGNASRPLRGTTRADIAVQPVAGAAAGCNLQPHAQQPPAVFFAAPSQHLHRHRPLVHGPVSVSQSQQATPVFASGVAGFGCHLQARANELPFPLAVIAFAPILDGAVRQPKGTGYVVLWRDSLSVAVCVGLAFSCQRGVEQISESLRSPAVGQRIGQVPFRREVGGHPDNPHIGCSPASEALDGLRIFRARLVMVGPDDYYPALQRGPVGLVWRHRPMRGRRYHHVREQLGCRVPGLLALHHQHGSIRYRQNAGKPEQRTRFREAGRTPGSATVARVTERHGQNELVACAVGGLEVPAANIPDKSSVGVMVGPSTRRRAVLRVPKPHRRRILGHGHDGPLFGLSCARVRRRRQLRG
jgi:hypothetical protein